MEKLTEKETQKRMTEWRNLKVLHKKAVEQNKKLRRKLQNAEDEIRELRDIVFKQAEVIESQQLQIEELQQIVFGRKRKKKDDDDEDDFRPKKEKKEPKKRDKDSYKRPIPDEEDVTSHEYHNLDTGCPDCGTNLQDKEIIVFYEEDIPLPDKDTKLKQVIRHHSEKGYCPKCGKWHWAMDHPFTDVFLGQKVKFYIAYLSILLRLTFSQIQSLLWDTYRFRISDGEIAKILHKTADRLNPEFERLKEKLQNEKGIHLDETSWGRFYMWVKTSIKTDDVLYIAGKTRGKGNADELIGNNYKGIRITDGYNAYKNQPGIHQLCWSHPHTKLKNLAYSKSLGKGKRKHCCKTYCIFEGVYADLRKYIKEPFNEKIRKRQKRELIKRIKEWRKACAEDPKKLKNIKLQFRDEEVGKWLTCMDFEGIPCDNNKAERKLRHFVIKRKISFGNKSEKGHETFSVLASVLMTYWKRYKDNFFPELISAVG